jgi:hypothetical protein
MSEFEEWLDEVVYNEILENNGTILTANVGINLVHKYPPIAKKDFCITNSLVRLENIGLIKQERNMWWFAATPVEIVAHKRKLLESLDNSTLY